MGHNWSDLQLSVRINIKHCSWPLSRLHPVHRAKLQAAQCRQNELPFPVWDDEQKKIPPCDLGLHLHSGLQLLQPRTFSSFLLSFLSATDTLQSLFTPIIFTAQIPKHFNQTLSLIKKCRQDIFWDSSVISGFCLWFDRVYSEHLYRMSWLKASVPAWHARVKQMCMWLNPLLFLNHVLTPSHHRIHHRHRAEMLVWAHFQRTGTSETWIDIRSHGKWLVWLNKLACASHLQTGDCLLVSFPCP